jgi:hypothetical protein
MTMVIKGINLLRKTASPDGHLGVNAVIWLEWTNSKVFRCDQPCYPVLVPVISRQVDCPISTGTGTG